MADEDKKPEDEEVKAEGAARVPADFVASVLLATGKPALVLPYIEVAQPPGDRTRLEPRPESLCTVRCAHVRSATPDPRP